MGCAEEECSRGSSLKLVQPCVIETEADEPRTLQLGDTSLPEQSPDLTKPMEIPVETLQLLHHVLLEVEKSLPSSAISV